MQVTHTLITTDLSDAAMVSLPHAAAFAKAHGSRVTVLHANMPWQDTRDELDTRDSRLDDVRRTLAAMGVEARVNVVDGEPSHVIDEYIRSTNVDLVICTHHAKKVGSPLHNSVSRHLVENARCPVLVAHGPSTEPTIDVAAASYTKLFVSSDFSAASSVGLESTAGLARVLGAQVVAGHVIEVDGCEVIQGDHFRLPTTPPEHVGTVVRAREALQAEAEGLYNDNVHVDVICAETAAQGIVALALANHCDLVVVPSHGKGAVRRLLLGSTARAVLDLSPLPVLVLRKGVGHRE